MVVSLFKRCSNWKNVLYFPKLTTIHNKSTEMILQCQKDSYLQKFTAKVLSCENSPLPFQKEVLNGFEVVLDDTILFPEGGGQPDDRGTINGIAVVKVIKKDGKAVHFTKQPLKCGESAFVVLNWERRFDHMQQHSAQHLITALAESTLGAVTTSWNLGEKESSIELETTSLTDFQRAALEEDLNNKIRLALPLTVNYYDRDNPKLDQVLMLGAFISFGPTEKSKSLEMTEELITNIQVRTRLELPEDQSGPIRVVNIQGIDSNTCCGTHVQNLGHLQCIKLLFSEKGKKNKTNLFFVAGNRVLKYLASCIEREQKLTSVLKGGPSEHALLADKMQKLLKISQKKHLMMSRDLAILEGKQFKQLTPRPKYFTFHRKEGDIEFMNLFINEVNDKDIFFFLTTGEEKGAGQLLVSGNAEVLEQLAPVLSTELEAKGFIKNGRFQAKANNLGKRAKCEELIKQYIT